MVMLFDDEETVALPESVHLEHMSVMTVRARGSKASWKDHQRGHPVLCRDRLPPDHRDADPVGGLLRHD